MQRYGGAVLVRGAPGIGKSALLADAATRASDLRYTEVRVLGEQDGSALPYAGLQQLAHSLGAVLEGLAEPQRSALATALGRGEAAVPDVFLVGPATLNLVVESAARAPVLLIADDVQRLDDPTVSVLAFMARRVRTEPVLLIGAAREGYRSRLNTDELTTLTLPPLSQADAESLLDAVARVCLRGCAAACCEQRRGIHVPSDAILGRGGCGPPGATLISLRSGRWRVLG